MLQKMNDWYDSDKASYFFDKKRFNNDECAQFNKCMRDIMKDKSSLEKLKKEYNK